MEATLSKLSEQEVLLFEQLAETAKRNNALLEMLLERQAESTERQEGQEEMIDDISEIVWKDNFAKAGSQLSEIDFWRLGVAFFVICPAFWSAIKCKVPTIMCEKMETSVKDFTEKALKLLHSNSAAEVAHVQPLALTMIGELVDIINTHFSLQLTTNTKGSFQTALHIYGTSCTTVTGKYDAAILDSTRIHVISWEFKNVKDDLEDKDIAQLVATMSHGIDVNRFLMGKVQQRGRSAS